MPCEQQRVAIFVIGDRDQRSFDSFSALTLLYKGRVHVKITRFTVCSTNQQ
jgi:hypothetical protein